VTVPRTAISYNTYGDFAFVVENNDQGQKVVTRRSVRSGDARENRVEILEGLEVGETIVSKGLLRLRSGQPVKIQETRGNAEKNAIKGQQEASE
jgi:membrane fusion protein (multidrug efflux system)